MFETSTINYTNYPTYEVKQCRFCKHWGSDKSTGEKRTCTKISFAETHEGLAHTAGYLDTHADFGCVLYQKKDENFF